MNINIRKEAPGDYDKITKVNDLAFEQTNEGSLIKKLREKKEFLEELSLVAEFDGKVVGHILFFPIKIKSGDIERQTLSLAPMAVVPGLQNKGIGSKLVKEGLKKADQLGYKSVLVIGHPQYYPRFGFEPASKWKIKAEFEVPDEAFMALELKQGELKDKSGTIWFPQEYYDCM